MFQKCMFTSVFLFKELITCDYQGPVDVRCELLRLKLLHRLSEIVCIIVIVEFDTQPCFLTELYDTSMGTVLADVEGLRQSHHELLLFEVLALQTT